MQPGASVKLREKTGLQPLVRQKAAVIGVVVPIILVVIIILIAYSIRSAFVRRQRRRQRRQQQRQQHQHLYQSEQFLNQEQQMRRHAVNNQSEQTGSNRGDAIAMVEINSSNSSASVSDANQQGTSRRVPRAQNRVVRGFGPPPYLRALNRNAHGRANNPAAPRTPNHPPAIIRIQRHLQSATGLSIVELDAVAPETEFPEKIDAADPGDSGGTRDDSDGDENESDGAVINQRMDSSQDVVCPVCLEDMRSNLQVRKLPCGHFFHSACIQEWTSKANRCPVCTLPVVDQQQLEKSRLAMLNGETPEPLLSGPDLPATRQRRRRTRGENGTFQLRDGLSSRILSPTTTLISTQISETRNVEPRNLPNNDNTNANLTNIETPRSPGTHDQRWTVQGRVASF